MGHPDWVMRRNCGKRPCVLMRMGVFQMAIPFSGLRGERMPATAQWAARGTGARRVAGQPMLGRPVHCCSARKELRGTLAEDAGTASRAGCAWHCWCGSAWREASPRGTGWCAGQQKRVYGICYRFTGDATDAEDITQDVFIKVYRNLASFDADKGSFGTWITTLTRNMLVDNYRRTKLERATDSMDVSASGEDDGRRCPSGWPTLRPNQEQWFAGLELKARIQSALAEGLAGPARGGDPARPGRHGLQRDCAGAEDSGGHGEEPDQPGARGTGKAVATYRRAGGVSGEAIPIR